MMRSFSPFEALAARLTAFFWCSKNSLVVGELTARASSADANSGSSASALSKCGRDSCASSRSERSRPVRNSLRASSELVVMGIFPLSEEAATLLPDLVHAIELAAKSASIMIQTFRVDSLEYMEVLFCKGEGRNGRSRGRLPQGTPSARREPQTLDSNAGFESRAS